MNAKTKRVYKTGTPKQPTRTYLEAARNPALNIEHKRPYLVEYYQGGEPTVFHPNTPYLARHYKRLDTAIPAALRFILKIGVSKDVVVIRHSEYKFEVARIYIRGPHIDIEFDAALVSFTV